VQYLDSHFLFGGQVDGLPDGGEGALPYGPADGEAADHPQFRLLLVLFIYHENKQL